MANKRILYAAQALFVAPTGLTGVSSTGYQQLHRVQSCGYDYSRNIQDISQFGQLDILDSLDTDLPTTTLNASYLLTNVRNESGIGLYVGGDDSILRNIFNESQKEQNYFIRVVPDGNNAAGYAATDGGAIGFGNASLASYQTQAAVGGFPTAQFTVNALDALWSTVSSGFASPTITPNDGQPIPGYTIVLPVASTGQAGQVTALRAGDITLNLNGAGFGVNNLCIQSYNLQLDLNLDPITCIGSKFPTSREITFPIKGQLSVEANMRDIGQTGRLSTLQCGGSKYDVSILLRQSTCNGSQGAVKAAFYLDKAVLESQSFNSTIGPSKSVTLNFTVSIGASGSASNIRCSGALV